MVGPRFVFNISWLVNYIAINCPHFLKKSIKNLTGRARQTEALDEDSPSACSLSAVWGGGCDCPARRPSLPPSSEWSWRRCVPGTDSHQGSGRREGGGWSWSWSHWTCNIHVYISLSLSLLPQLNYISFVRQLLPIDAVLSQQFALKWHSARII